jgi:hypothetical protein
MYASAGKDGTIKIWDTTSATRISDFTAAHSGFAVRHSERVWQALLGWLILYWDETPTGGVGSVFAKWSVPLILWQRLHCQVMGLVHSSPSSNLFRRCPQCSSQLSFHRTVHQRSLLLRAQKRRLPATFSFFEDYVLAPDESGPVGIIWDSRLGLPVTHISIDLNRLTLVFR